MSDLKVYDSVTDLQADLKPRQSGKEICDTICTTILPTPGLTALLSSVVKHFQGATGSYPKYTYAIEKDPRLEIITLGKRKTVRRLS